jgi:hypothetical protein
MPEAGLPANLVPAQLTRMGQLSDQWSFLWDKRRSLWIAAEDQVSRHAGCGRLARGSAA